MAKTLPSTEPNKHLKVTPDAVTLDGLDILATDDGIQVEQVTHGLYVVHLALYVESVEVDTELPHTSVTTYTPIRRH